LDFYGLKTHFLFFYFFESSFKINGFFCWKWRRVFRAFPIEKLFQKIIQKCLKQKYEKFANIEKKKDLKKMPKKIPHE
jgi:hypothetical protein